MTFRFDDEFQLKVQFTFIQELELVAQKYGIFWTIIAHKNLWQSENHLELIKDILKERKNMKKKHWDRIPWRNIFNVEAEIHSLDSIRSSLSGSQVFKIIPFLFFQITCFIYSAVGNKYKK